MPETELLSMLLQIHADMDAQFQFWISISFAVLIASFVAGEKLSPAGRVVIALLYVSAIAVFVMRYERAFDYFQYVLELYETTGVANPRSGVGIGPLRRTVFLLGSVVTALSILFPKMGRHRDMPRDA